MDFLVNNAKGIIPVVVFIASLPIIIKFVRPVLEVIRVCRRELPEVYGLSDDLKNSSLTWSRVPFVFVKGNTGDWLRDIFMFAKFKWPKMAVTQTGPAFSLLGGKFVVPWQDLGSPKPWGSYFGIFTLAKFPKVRIALKNSTIQWLMENSQGRWTSTQRADG